MAHHLTYITISTSQVDLVDFNQVNEAKDTLKYSLDGTLFIVKWDGATPSSIEAISSEYKSALLTHSQAVVLMDTSAWQTPIE
tara:strand:+ start:354 stop:602 length:249 start_codon:yes stop_codon:yes gene_type:complete